MADEMLKAEAKAFVEKNWEDIVKDIESLVAIRSVEDLDHATDEMPYGPASYEALCKGVEIAERLGLDAHNCDGHIGYADVPGDSERQIAMIAHTDIVPEGSGWTFDPFKLTRKDGYLIGRGVLDDKGPFVLELYCAKFFAERAARTGERLPYTIRCIIGNNEDSGNCFTVKKFFDSLEAGGKGTITVGAACGVAGIISGTITMTGLANEMINAIVAVAGDKLFIALFLTMLCCIVLGMGVPTTATYCIMAATCAPILTRMGVPIMAAHFFVFYFGIVADITPPVALAAYAGSAIAKSNPMRTAFNATKLAIAAFIIPYVFCFSPSMLLIETNVLEVVVIAITSLVGIFAVAAALEGYLFADMGIVDRILLVAGGLMMIVPGHVTDLIGLLLIVAGGAIGLMVSRRKKQA